MDHDSDTGVGQLVEQQGIWQSILTLDCYSIEGIN
jgi:hypothetical protein